MNSLTDSSIEPTVEHCTLEPGQDNDPHATRLGKFLQATIKNGGSDILVKSDSCPRIRLKGTLKSLDTDEVDFEEMISIVNHILTEEQQATLHKDGSVDFAYTYDTKNRFRVNVFQARGKLSIAARLITSKILPFADLYLPQVLAEIAMAPQGIVLLSGMTGSGKTTTIASMLDYVNERKNIHIITIEDPIEFVFEDKKATIHQRELGIDVRDFKVGLRALVRENPDVVLIGEMRDAETIEAALHAAETGHLVFGTVHASSCTQTITRMYDMFPPEEREHVRKIVGEQLRAIVYQNLLPSLKKNVPRVPAVEILIGNTVVQKYILEGREAELMSVMRTQEATLSGMIDFNGSLVKLVDEEMIHTRVAMEATTNPDELQMRLKKII